MSDFPNIGDEFTHQNKTFIVTDVRVDLEKWTAIVYMKEKKEYVK